jgi:hypothetical protein
MKETRIVLGLGDTQGLPSAVPLSKKAASAAAAKPGVPARRVQSIVLETKLRGQPLALGFAASAGTAGGPTYRLATNPAKRLQLEAVREVRDLGRTSLVARERYAFHARVTRVTQIAFSYETQPELSPGKLLFEHAQTKAEARTKLAGLDMSAAVAWDRDRLLSKTSTLTTLSAAGSIDSQSSLRFSCTDRSGYPDPALPVEDLRLAYERKPTASFQVAFSGAWRAWDGKRPDELAWQIDLTAVF